MFLKFDRHNIVSLLNFRMAPFSVLLIRQRPVFDVRESDHPFAYSTLALSSTSCPKERFKLCSGFASIHVFQLVDTPFLRSTQL